MDKTEQEKLLNGLQEEEKLILSELNDIARKNPQVDGDFNVPYPNEGDTMEENAREIMEFERTKAVADNLGERLKNIRAAIEKLKT